MLRKKSDRLLQHPPACPPLAAPHVHRSRPFARKQPSPGTQAHKESESPASTAAWSSPTLDFGAGKPKSDPRGEPDSHFELRPSVEMTGALRHHSGGP